MPPHCPHFADVAPVLVLALDDVVELVVLLIAFRRDDAKEVALVLGFTEEDVELVVLVLAFIEEEEEEAGVVALSPVGVSSIASLALTQPLLSVMALGHATCLKVTAGLSAFSNQSKRQ